MKRVLVAGAVVLLLGAGVDVAQAASGDLVRAIRRHDRAAVQALIREGVDVNERQPDEATALHYAAYEDDVAIAEVLIEAGASAKAINQLGITPLHLACGNGSAAMVALLLKAGADPNAGQTGRETPVMTAARVGVPAVMKLLLTNGGNVNATESLRNQTAAMWAAAQGHSETLQLLVAAGANVQARTNVAPLRGMGPGAPPQTGFVINGGNGYTAFLFAARAGDIEAGQVLLKAGANVDDVSADGMGALVLSTVRGHTAFASFLLDQGANPNLDGAGYTALHWAVGTWESELTVRAITTEREGEWYTIAGLKEGKLALVESLLKHGADPNARMKKAPARAGSSKNANLPELEGATPLILAAMAGDAVVMRALVAAGADPKLTTNAGGTVLMAAAGLGHVQGEDLIRDVDAKAAAEMALEIGGGEVKAPDALGNTAVHYAAYMRHDAVVQLLIDRGAPLNARNKYGETPLWAAQLVVQFAGGGTFQLLPSPAADLLRKAGAQNIDASYSLARPTDWPDVQRGVGDQVPEAQKPASAGAR
jgi:ankyrin repeat protein